MDSAQSHCESIVAPLYYVTREVRPPGQPDEMARDAKRRLPEAGRYRAAQSLRLGVPRSAEYCEKDSSN